MLYLRLITYSVIAFQVFHIMLKDETFYPAFKGTKAYMKLLAELDLLEASNLSITSEDTNMPDYNAAVR